MQPCTKHINQMFHHFRKYINDGSIKVLPVDKKEQTADIFIKPLAQNQFLKLRKKLIGYWRENIASIVERECYNIIFRNIIILRSSTNERYLQARPNLTRNNNKRSSQLPKKYQNINSKLFLNNSTLWAINKYFNNAIVSWNGLTTINELRNKSINKYLY